MTEKSQRRLFNTDNLMWLQHQFYTRLLGKVLPISWFAPKAPRPADLNQPSGKLQLQIVSHCWQYAHMLNFQISSLFNHPPRNVDVIYTLYYAKEDAGVVALIKRFNDISIPNVTWDWQALPKASLFRRAIGRHQASLKSKAHWIWFADCDLIFHQHCLDSLAQVLQNKQTGLVFPLSEQITDLLPADHPMLNQPNDTIADIDKSLFYTNAITKAKGAFQIVHGDVARSAGYCGTIKLYQTPSAHWRKTYEDSIFRRLIEYDGEPIDVKNLYRIRHIEKGRYAEASVMGNVRGRIRQTTDESKR